MLTYKNPMSINTNGGDIIPPSCANEIGTTASHIVVIDSRLRDFNTYINANHFRMRLPRPYRGVYSVELLMAIIPIVGADNFVLLNVKADGRTLNAIEGGHTTSVSQQIFTPVYDNAFAVIPLVENYATEDITFWRKGEQRAIFYAKPRIETMREIEITLEQFGAAGSAFGTVTAYPLADAALPVTTNLDRADNVFFVFEIVSHS